MQRRHWLVDRLTHAYARLLDSDGVIDVTEHRSDGEAHRVYWVAARRWPAAGQFTPVGTIILNEDRLADLPDGTVDYVFLHEVGHARLPGIVTLVLYAVRLLLTVAVVLGLFWLILGVTMVESPGIAIGGSVELSPWPWIVTFLSLVGLVGVSWIHEGHADLFVVSKIGGGSYLRWHDEVAQNSGAGGLYRVFRRFFYPSPRLVIWVADLLEKHPEE